MKFNMYLMVLLCSFSLMQASDEPAVTTAEVELDFFVSSAIQKGLANLKIKTEEDYAKSKQDYLKYKQIREQRKQDLVNYSNQSYPPKRVEDQQEAQALPAGDPPENLWPWKVLRERQCKDHCATFQAKSRFPASQKQMEKQRRMETKNIPR